MWPAFRDGVRKRDKVPYSWAWGADGLLSMSSLFSFSGLSSIQPLHSHSGWVSQQGFNVYVCVLHTRLGVSLLWFNRLKMMQPMRPLIHRPTPTSIALASPNVTMWRAPCEDCACSITKSVVRGVEVIKSTNNSSSTTATWAASCSLLERKPSAHPLSLKNNTAVWWTVWPCECVMFLCCL